jgi:hypothetical protein
MPVQGFIDDAHDSSVNYLSRISGQNKDRPNWCSDRWDDPTNLPSTRRETGFRFGSPGLTFSGQVIRWGNEILVLDT